MFWRVTALILLSIDLVGFALFWIIGRQDTEFARNFSDEKFSEIYCGSSQDQVTKLLGPPIWKHHTKNDYPDGRIDETWGYTRQGDPTANYRIRNVAFDSNGQVIRLACIDYTD